MHGDLHVPWQPQDPGGLLGVNALVMGSPKVEVVLLGAGVMGVGG